MVAKVVSDETRRSASRPVGFGGPLYNRFADDVFRNDLRARMVAIPVE